MLGGVFFRIGVLSHFLESTWFRRWRDYQGLTDWFLCSCTIGETVASSDFFWRNFYLRFCVIKIKHWQHEFHNVFVKQVNKYPSSCFKARETEALESHSLVFAMMWDTGTSGIGIYRVLNYKTWCSCLWKTVSEVCFGWYYIFFIYSVEYWKKKQNVSNTPLQNTRVLTVCARYFFLAGRQLLGFFFPSVSHFHILRHTFSFCI